MRKTMKAPTLRDNQSHDDVTVSIASCETSQLRRMPTKTGVSTARRRSWFRHADRRERREGFSSC